MKVQPMAILAGVGVASVSVRLFVRWWQREAARVVREPAPAAVEAEEDMCAICLERPRYRCMTACRHSFCTDCFVSWWRQQQGSNAELALTRCPLCTQRVTSVTPLYTSTELVDGSVSRASTLMVYNWCASLADAQPLRRGWTFLQRARKLSVLSALTLFAANAVLWAVADLPPPRDNTLRLYVFCHLLQARWCVPGAVLDPEEVRDRMHGTMSSILLYALATSEWLRDGSGPGRIWAQRPHRRVGCSSAGQTVKPCGACCRKPRTSTLRRIYWSVA